MLRGWSLAARSGALLGAYAVILAGVYGGFTAFLLRRETALAHERLQQTAQLVAVELDTQLEAGKQRLATVAHLPGLVHGLERLEDARGEGVIAPWTTLHYIFFRSPIFIAGAFLLDRSGKVLWTEPPGLPWVGSTLADVVWRAKTEPVSAGLDADALLAVPHVVVAFPIEGADGEPAGFLGGVVDLTASGFTGILHAIRTTEGRYLSIVDQNGRVLASTDGSAPVSPASDSASIASVALAEAPWHVVAGEPRETTLAPIRRLQRWLLAVGLVMLGLALALGSRFTRGFVRAIGRLTRSAEVMTSGDLSQPVAVDEDHLELATLGRTFERMRTEVRRSHDVLTQRLAEREDLMRLKEEFLANISHELRTPLNVIFGYTEMLLEDEDDVSRRDTLDRIRAQSEQLLQLVRDLMTLSGLNAGKIVLEICPLSVEMLVGRIRPLAEQLAQGRAVAAVFECTPGIPLMATDPLRLEQVLTNLLTNAFKFTVEGSVTLRIRHAAGRVVFEVVDTGIGIPATALPHIFDEFRQVNGSMSRQHGGMGLGLALVRRLVDLLGGEVTVASRDGAGSTFTVALPVEHPSGATKSSAEHAA